MEDISESLRKIVEAEVAQGVNIEGFYERFSGQTARVEADLLFLNYAVLLVWNFAEEVRAQQHEFRTKGGRFVIPLTKLTVA